MIAINRKTIFLGSKARPVRSRTRSHCERHGRVEPGLRHCGTHRGITDNIFVLFFSCVFMRISFLLAATLLMISCMMGKNIFFLIIFMGTKKLLSRPLCAVFRDHITFS
jgi:hypothetical protein